MANSTKILQTFVQKQLSSLHGNFVLNTLHICAIFSKNFKIIILHIIDDTMQ